MPESPTEPHQPPPDEEEPDYRFTLANERTFLAWIRTALALLAGSIAVMQLVPEFGFPGARHVIGALLALTGVAITLAAARRWRAVQAAMRKNQTLPSSSLPSWLAGGLAVLGCLVIALVLIAKAS